MIAVSKVMHLWYCVKESDHSTHITCEFSGLTTKILESQRASLEINCILLVIVSYCACIIHTYMYVCMYALE